MDKDGSPHLDFWNENGKSLVALAAKSEGTGLVLFDENGKPRNSLSVGKDGSPGLGLSDKNGKPRIGLVVLKDGPDLSLFDENGKPRVGLGVLKEGSGVGLLDENGKTLVGLETGEGGSGMLDVFNALGKKVVSVQANKKNCGSVIVSDQNGEIKHSLTAE